MGSLRRLIAGKRVVPPVPPGMHAIVISVEMPEPRRARTKASGATCFIEYTDSSGKDSSRQITIRRIDGHFGKPETIGAHCHVRDAYKAFRVDRIRAMYDCITGEEIDPLAHLMGLHRHGALKIEDKALTRIMRIMTFMARCDGDYNALEQNAMDDILGRYFRFFGGEDDDYERARIEAMRLAPDSGDVLRSIAWLKKAPLAGELARFVLQGSMAMIDADGHHRDEEIYWALELGEELKKIAVRA